MPLAHTPGKKDGQAASASPTDNSTKRKILDNLKWKMVKENSGKEAGGLGNVWAEDKKDRDTCKKCLKKVKSNQMGVICDYCQIWFHNECVKVDKEEYKMLNRLEEKVKWYCEECCGVVEGMQEENKELIRENVHLKELNQELSNYLKQLEEKVEKIEERMDRRFNKVVTERIEEAISSDYLKQLKEKVDTIEEKMDQGFNREITERIEEAISRKEGQILEKVNDAHLKYEEHIREQVKQLGMRTTAEIRGLEQKTRQKKLEKGEFEHIQREVVDKCVREIDRKREQEGKSEQEARKANDNQMKDIETKLEILEKEKRKKNLIIYNLIESDKEDARERYMEDREHIKNIFTEELLQGDYGVERLVRLGKRNSEQRRPLLVEMKTEKEKMDILVNAKRLRHSVLYPRLYVNRDLTASERKKEKELRDQLREKRNNGENHFTIRRGKIVNKPTSMLRDENNNNDIAIDGAAEEQREGAVGGGARRKTVTNFQ